MALAAEGPCSQRPLPPDLIAVCEKGGVAGGSVTITGPTVTGALYIEGADAVLGSQRAAPPGCADCVWYVSYICNSRVGDGQEKCTGGTRRCNWQLVHVELSTGGPKQVIQEYCPPHPQPAVLALTGIVNTLLDKAAHEQQAVAPSVHYQPRSGAITQLPTYFAVDAPSQAPVAFDVKVPQEPEVLLHVTATPQSWTWDFGDGSAALTTSDPGGDYPDGRVTHTYRRRGQVSVTTTSTSSVSWTLTSPYGGLPTTTLDQPATSAPTTTPLQVREARAQLTG